MPRLRPLLLAAVVLLGPACPPAAAAPAMAADALLDTIGVNLDPRDEALVAHLRGAGIRHVRARGVADPADPTWAALRALTEAGLRVDLVAEPGTDWATFADAAASLGKGLESLEAEGDAGPLRLAARAHPALRDVPLLAPAGDGAADYHTARLQLDGRCPGCVPGPADGLGSASPGGSLQVTEATLGAGVPEAVAARYLPRLLLGQATTATRTYLGALAGEQADPGLLGADGSPARAHRDLANLVALLADPGPAFTPGRLAYRLSGDTDGLRHLLLQKADGRFWLVLWVEKPSFDPASGRELALPAQPVSIGLADPVAAARAFAPDLGTAPERHFAGPTRTIELEVPDRPLLVELLPQPPPEAVSAAPATSRPGGSPPAGDPSRAPGPPAAAGGDRRTPATTRGSAPAAAAPAGRERGPLAFTGSAALPLLVASGLLVLVGVAALAASRRRWHHHR